MNYRRLGRTNLNVSELSLGTVELGLDYGITPGGRPDETEAARLLHRALDLGINFLDTARGYGESEAIIGRALHSRRGEFFLTTKVSSYEKEGLHGAALRARVRESVAQSLAALQADTIDVLMIHSASTEVLVRGELMEILADLRQAGSVRWLGASVYGEEAALAAIQSGSCDCLQLAYSLLDRRPERRTFAAASEAEVGLVARSVLLKGALTYRYRQLPEGLQPLQLAVERLLRTAAIDLSALPELAYRFVLAQPSIHTALVGASSVAELETSVRYAEPGAVESERLQGLQLEDDQLLNPGKWPG